MTKMTTSTRSPGRPRDNKVGPSLLAAARQLVLQHGYCGVSIQMIATEAGVGRQTLYRRWPSKAELVLAAFLESAGDADVLSDGRAEKRLLHFLVNVFRNLQQDGPAIRNLIASAQDDPEFLKSFRASFVEPRAEIVATIFRDGIANGEILEDADVEMAVAAFHGAFWYHLLLGGKLDAEFAQRLTRLIMKSISKEPREEELLK
ncbi:transcriptional regulator TetR [Acetobacter malorum]|uniref:Transcriptional regulator TetR n=1 Tax=Acetobacter malorum TaxID=178901 RepID=A0A177G547_9PROT|nr:transcriptional regulator TetR [Acetobacter malorum]